MLIINLTNNTLVSSSRSSTVWDDKVSKLNANSCDLMVYTSTIEIPNIGIVKEKEDWSILKIVNH
jgi:hypothetical protein